MMAKKRTPSKAETVARPLPPPEDTNPLELAAPVSARVQIQGVLLIESSVKRGADTSIGQAEFRVNINISNVQYGADRANGKLFVVPTFTLKAERVTESEGTLILSIDASFALHYSIQSIGDFEDESIKAFALTNGVFNAWPYWREYVQSTAARMGLPPIVIPVFRLG
jgi:preprotein translocase subunit SecB